MSVKSTISARVISNKPLSAQGGSASGGQKGKACKYFRMALALAKPVKKVVPGQFIHIRLDSKKHILPRPFTIYDVKNNGQVIEVVYQVVGQGTELMSRLKPSDKVRVLCPLGNGFRIDKKALMSVLVGGGVGLAGLYLLLKELMASEKRHCEPAGRGNLKTGQRDCGVYPERDCFRASPFAMTSEGPNARNDSIGKSSNIKVFIGSRSKDDLCLLPEFRKLSKYIVVTTEDGSSGAKGLITTALETFLRKSCILHPASDIAIYSCGPSGMSQAVRQIAIARNIPCQLSLEARMACGVGLCRVCVCRTTKGYSTVCEDGPVFDASQL